MTPRASFVIPAYNAERWISKAVYSCRNQTIKEIEIVVVNDGSTDGTREIVEWHASQDKRVRLFNTPNQKSSEARNYGNDQALAPIIMMLDADDMATRNRAKDTIAAFHLKKCDFLYGSFWAVDAMGSAEKKILSGPFDAKVSRDKKLNFICHSTTAYTKKLSQDIRYESGQWNQLAMEDWKFQWEAYRRGYKIQSIKNPLCYYRVTESGQYESRDQAAALKVKEEYLSAFQ